MLYSKRKFSNLDTVTAEKLPFSLRLKFKFPYKYENNDNDVMLLILCQIRQGFPIVSLEMISRFQD